VKLGFISMNTPEELAPDVLAKLLEDLGYDSLWVGEHSHIPVSRSTPYPAGGPLPEMYKRMMDPFLSLLAAANVTESLVVGTAVTLPLEHDLFDLAKTVATLDRFCGGRFMFGVGVGWNEEELANHRPIPWRHRYGALAECVAALRALWSEEQSEFHGTHYDFDPVWSLPKPAQRPHPPVLCGMGGRVGSAQAVAWADGWMPMDVALGDITKMEKKIRLFREAEERAGRPPMPISMVAFGDPTLETLARYRDMGVERTIVGGNRKGWDDGSLTQAFLERYAGIMEQLD
jgi:probable F420-dependent oxidoreductase